MTLHQASSPNTICTVCKLTKKYILQKIVHAYKINSYLKDQDIKIHTFGERKHVQRYIYSAKSVNLYKNEKKMTYRSSVWLFTT